MVARLGLSSPPPPVWFVWLRSLGLLGCVVMGLSKLWRWLCIVGRGGCVDFNGFAVGFLFQQWLVFFFFFSWLMQLWV